MTPNEEQKEAIKRMLSFLEGSGQFFLLAGAAGTGKTFTTKEFVQKTKGRLVFTAPTNKATRVLRDVFQGEAFDEDYFPETRTIYSLLGLRLEANGEIKELTKPDNPLDLSRFMAVVVDEASMVNTILWKYIKLTADNQKIKFIFMGDPAQLPPVKESMSPVWAITDKFTLSKVMRFDNQILALATRLRNVVDHPAPSLSLTTDNDGLEGIWKVDAFQFEKMLMEEADSGNFSIPNKSKAIAWRNATVDRLNAMIRRRLYGEPGDWFTDDRIIMTEPAKDLKSGECIATTDSEGTIICSEELVPHPIYSEFLCHRIVVNIDDLGPVTLWALHKTSSAQFVLQVSSLAAAAKTNGRLWKDYWTFRESFHSIRYGYAITAHRSQGSTYEKAFVNYGDILLNRNRQEAFRCLYVACTRAKKQLILS